MKYGLNTGDERRWAVRPSTLSWNGVGTGEKQ